MDKNELLKSAIIILQQISNDWDEDEVVEYSNNLASFDEVVEELRCIVFKSNTGTRE